MILLYNWLSAMNCTPGPDNSNLINTEKAVPTKPAKRAKIRYNVPMSFALLDKNHLSVHWLMEDRTSSIFTLVWFDDGDKGLHTL